MKPCMHLEAIGIFSLYNVIVRLTKIMNNLFKVCEICTFKVIFWHQKSTKYFCFFFCEEYFTRRLTFISDFFWTIWFLKYFVFQECAQFLSTLFIILAGLRMTLFSDKTLISHRCIPCLMPALIKKSWRFLVRSLLLGCWSWISSFCTSSSSWFYKVIQKIRKIHRYLD